MIKFNVGDIVKWSGDGSIRTVAYITEVDGVMKVMLHGKPDSVPLSTLAFVARPAKISGPILNQPTTVAGLELALMKALPDIARIADALTELARPSRREGVAACRSGRAGDSSDGFEVILSHPGERRLVGTGSTAEEACADFDKKWMGDRLKEQLGEVTQDVDMQGILPSRDALIERLHIALCNQSRDDAIGMAVMLLPTDRLKMTVDKLEKCLK